MSDYGLKVKNDDLVLLIDSTYVNWALWEHGESASTAAWTLTVTFSDATAEPPLIAIKPSSSVYSGVYYLTRSGSNYTGFVMRGNAASYTIDWQAFVSRKDKSSETYGLRVYNAATDLVFDSGHTPMILSDVDPATPGYNSVVNVTHPSDANAYFVQGVHGYWHIFTDWDGMFTYWERYISMMKYVNATTLSFGGRVFQSGVIPVYIEDSTGYWPASFTVMTIEKAF